jgi:hypothetical protein
MSHAATNVVPVLRPLPEAREDDPRDEPAPRPVDAVHLPGARLLHYRNGGE